MTLVISDKVQQNKIKDLASPVFDLIENLLHDKDLDLKTKNKICNSVIVLNKAMFARDEKKPTWSVIDIQKSLKDIIRTIPHAYWENLKEKDKTPFRRMQEYLNSFDKTESVSNNIPNQPQSFLAKIRQIFGIGERIK